VTDLHYWRGNDFSLGEVSGLDPSGATVYLNTPARTDHDTLLEVIAFPSIRMATGTTAVPPLNWWVSAAARCVFGWDPTGSVTPVDITEDDTNAVLGWCELFPHVSYYGTTVGYEIVWMPLGGVYRFKGRRKGYGLGTLPDVTATFWTEDQHGVFVHASAYSTTFAANLSIRSLWATDTPAP